MRLRVSEVREECHGTLEVDSSSVLMEVAEDANAAAAAEPELDPIDRDVLAAKRMFIAGFFLLPFVWILNILYFRKRSAPALQACEPPSSSSLLLLLMMMGNLNYFALWC